MKTVLIVDDEVAIAEVLEAIITDAGYRAITASNGKQALERIKEEVPDLVLTDFMMPMLGSAGLLTALHAHPEHRHITVIMMSSLPESAIQARCSGYAAFLRKPFKISDVQRIVRNTIHSADQADPTE